MTLKLWLVRHGETEWSLSGAHTSRTDIPLTQYGREEAGAMRDYLLAQKFTRVLTSPMQRARETCRIAGFAGVAETSQNLCEWDYGQYEGRSTAEIRAKISDWSVWDEDPPGGEAIAALGRRAQGVIEDCLASGGRIALFSHAHFLRVLAAVWVGLPPQSGRLLALDTGSVSTLGFERETQVIETWNRSFKT